MITNPMARALRQALIPSDQKFTATVTLLPDGNSPTVLTCAQCWWKPLDTRLDNYSGIQLEGNERLINIPAEMIDPVAVPASANVEIRRRDLIQVGSVKYTVISSGLRSVSSRWEVLVREVES